MRFRDLLSLVAIVSSVSACNLIDAESRRPKPPEGARNVLLVTIDTLRADHVGVYGRQVAHTPHLDTLAERGVLFHTAISSSPLTLPSHSTILTGAWPTTHGARHNGAFKLAPDLVTLAERYQDRGYATGAFVSALVLEDRYGLDQGFDVYDDDVSDQKAAPGGFLERSAGDTTRRALAWLEETDRPFFGWVHYYDPHMDYKPPFRFREQFPNAPYDAEIAYVDFELGEILASLEVSGRLENTIVVVTSDHGESLGEHGEYTHSSTLYDAVLHVPLVIQGPGIPAAREVHGVVRTVDIAPTLLALSGLAPFPAEQVAGIDLAPLWEAGQAPAAREAYAETLATQLENGWAPLFALRTNEHHYVRAPRPELYDMSEDPKQIENLIETAPDRARPHQERLDAEVGRILDDARVVEQLDIDSDRRAELAALGYVLPEGEVVDTGIDPKDGLPYLSLVQRATAAFERHEFEDAEELFKQALDKLPNHTRSNALLSLIYLTTGRPDEGLPYIERAIDGNPYKAAYRATRAEMLLALGREDEARQAYEQAIEVDPESTWSKVGQAWIAVEDGHMDAARRHSHAALDAEGRESVVPARIGVIWMDQGDTELAMKAFRRAVEIDPLMTYAQMRLAIEAARTQRKFEAEARACFAGDLVQDPSLGAELGVAFAEGGDWDRAESILRELGNKYPTHPKVRRGLIEVLRHTRPEELPPDMLKDAS